MKFRTAKFAAILLSVLMVTSPVAPVLAQDAPQPREPVDRHALQYGEYGASLYEDASPLEKRYAAIELVGNLETTDERQQRQRKRAERLLASSVDQYRDHQRVTSKHVFVNDS